MDETGMSNSRSTPDTPPQLVDAVARIGQAGEDYLSLKHALNEFLYEFVKGMVKPPGPGNENFALQLRHPDDGIVSGRPGVLVAQIAEHLRTSLDYVVYQLSAMNEPNLNKQVPQFVIADSKSSFDRQAKTRLRYLTAEQVDFIERLQPFNDNPLLALLGEVSNQGKHRSLLSLRDMTGLEVHFAKLSDRGKYENCFVYPLEEGQALFAWPTEELRFLLCERYDAMPTLKSMIEHTADIVAVSYPFFVGLPLNLTIIRDP